MRHGVYSSSGLLALGAIPQVKALYPHMMFIGEIYDVGLYRPFLDYGCFDYLYDKVNLYDKLVGIETHGWSAPSSRDAGRQWTA